MDSKTKTNLAQILVISGLSFSVVGVTQAADPTAAVEQYIDDATITTQIKAKYATDKTVSALDISIETKDGVVQLTGHANSVTEKNRAEALAKQIAGVRKIRNDISV